MVELIDPSIFENNLSRSRIKEIRIGNSNSKLIIIDDFFVYPEKVREYALSAKYAKEASAHDNPGYISRFPFEPEQFLHTCGYLKELHFHDYRLNTYQPWHSHAGNVISVVYIIIADENVSSPLYFRNPVIDMMNPMNANMDPDYESPTTGWYNSEQMAYPSIHGTLYIFRSYLEHSIALKDNTDRRIALALNYNKK